MTHLALYLLGSPRIEREGRPVAINRRKVLALLVYLALTGQTQRRDRLASLLWPAHDQTSARGNLRRALSTLNRLLVDDWLEIDREQLALKQSSEVWVDVAQFHQHLSRCAGHRHPASQVCPACLEPLAQAVDLYQDDLLTGFTVPNCPEFDDWQLFHTESLRRELAEALQKLVQGHTAQDQFEPAITFARRWLALDPLQETAHRQLMRLLSLRGERNAALTQYDACRRLLAGTLGVEPEVETTTLYERIRDGQISSKAEEQGGKRELSSAPLPPYSPAHQLPHNLPSQPTPLIGREKELAKINDLLADPNCRLLTIAGPGGIGKTRLSVEVADRALAHFTAGVFFVPLASTDSVEDIMPRIAAAVDPERYPAGRAAADFVPKLQQRNPQMLLVLDNLEQLLPEGSMVIEKLLSQTRRLKLLVTSRELLNIRWEWRYNLDGLSYPTAGFMNKLQSYGATAMFLQRVRQTRRAPLTEVDAQAAAQICQLVGGMPLGIELAAAQASRLSCADIARALERNLDALAASLQGLPDRQRSLRASFEVTWANLSPTEQAIFRRLSLFRSSFTIEAAQAVAETEPVQLVRLINKSLLRQVSTERYDLHPVLRHYAQEKLAEHPAEQAQTLTRYRHYYTTFLHEHTDTLVQPTRSTENLAAFYAEIDNLWAGWTRIIGQQDAEEFASALVEALHAAGHARFVWSLDVLQMLEHQQPLLRSRSREVDVCLIDLIWIDTLADHLLDLDQDFEDEVQNHFSVYIENNVVDGRLVALPFWADFGLLYYRTDLLVKYGFAAPPATWDELEQMAAEIQAGERAEGRRDFWGFVWQGRKYEGLTCNALEWQASHGGGWLIEPEGVITVNNPQTIAAFERAARWLGKISPETVTATAFGNEKATKEVWVAGNAAFMRNWYHFFPGRINNSPAKDYIGVAPLPNGGDTPAATLGGQQIAISKYARHPREAIELVRYATRRKAQLQRLVTWPYWPPTAPDLYDHPDVVAVHPFLPRIKEAFSRNIVVRPSKVCGKLYPQVSKAYSTAVHSILTGQVEAATAVAELETRLVDLTNFPVGQPE